MTTLTFEEWETQFEPYCDENGFHIDFLYDDSISKCFDIHHLPVDLQQTEAENRLWVLFHIKNQYSIKLGGYQQGIHGLFVTKVSNQEKNIIAVGKLTDNFYN